MSSVLQQALANFTINAPEEALAVIETYAEKYINEDNDEDVENFLQWLDERNMKKRNRIWKFPRVSFDTFLDNPNFLGVGDKIYPTIRELGKKIVSGKHAEAVIVAGIGSGKTALSELLSCYMAHTLLCMRNPYDYYKLMKDKPITLINMGTSATQALDVTFSGIKQLLGTSPWFQQFDPLINAAAIRFRQNNILLMSGNSKSTTPLGYNIFYASLDEAAFYTDTDNNQTAEAIYTSLQRRIVSRFKYDGLVVAISSPKYEDDFIMTKIKNVERLGHSQVFTKQLPTWKCKPIDADRRSETFFFDNVAGRVLPAKPTLFSKINMLEDEFDLESDIWEIPNEFKNSFEQDPDKARRDFGAVPSKALQPFFPHKDIIMDMFTEDPSPVVSPGVYKFKDLPLRVPYYIHIDLAMNRNGKGDHAGFAMAHLDGFEEDPVTKERRKKIVVDLAERISAGPLGEVDLSEVRNRIYALKALGYHIALVTLDKFASEDFMQILRKKSVKAEYLSVDRTAEPYQLWKEKVYDGTVKCHKMEHLKKEMFELELIKGDKIDHPPKGSKDVSDAVCGAVYNTAINSKDTSIGTALGNINKIHDGTATQEDKRLYYQKIKEMVNQGIVR